jgi:hypothetical protein
MNTNGKRKRENQTVSLVYMCRVFVCNIFSSLFKMFSRGSRRRSFFNPPFILLRGFLCKRFPPKKKSKKVPLSSKKAHYPPFWMIVQM